SSGGRGAQRHRWNATPGNRGTPIAQYSFDETELATQDETTTPSLAAVAESDEADGAESRPQPCSESIVRGAVLPCHGNVTNPIPTPLPEEPPGRVRKAIEQH